MWLYNTLLIWLISSGSIDSKQTNRSSPQFALEVQFIMTGYNNKGDVATSNGHSNNNNNNTNGNSNGTKSAAYTAQENDT